MAGPAGTAGVAYLLPEAPCPTCCSRVRWQGYSRGPRPVGAAGPPPAGRTSRTVGHGRTAPGLRRSASESRIMIAETPRRPWQRPRFRATASLSEAPGPRGLRLAGCDGGGRAGGGAPSRLSRPA